MSSEEQRGLDLALDSDRCASLRFSPGSSAQADCMDTAAATRAADEARNARALAATNARIDADNAQRTREFQARMGASTSAGPASPYPMPSAAGLPGMQCSGSGDDQICNAQ